MKRSILLSSAVLPALLATGAMGQVVNFHMDHNSQFGFGSYVDGSGNVKYGALYHELYAGQGAYADPDNNIWNGFGGSSAFYNWKFYMSAGNPWPQPDGNPGNPYAAFSGSYASYGHFDSCTGDQLYSFAYCNSYSTSYSGEPRALQIAAIEGNASSDAQWTPVTLGVDWYSYDSGLIYEYYSFAVPNGTPGFLLGGSAEDSVNGNSTAPSQTETFTLGNVPTSGVYGLFLYGQCPLGYSTGTLFSVNSGNAHNGIDATLNVPGSASTNTFVEGQNFVIFENVTPDGGGNITITAVANPLCGIGNNNTAGEVDVNGFQLIFNPPPTALASTAAQNIFAGGTASFLFNPVFVSSPTFRWQSVISGVTNPLSNTTLGDGAVISGATTTNLVISGVTAAEVGLYQCVITSGATNGVSPLAPLTLLVNNATGPLQGGAPITSSGYILQTGDSITDFYGSTVNPQPYVGPNGIAGPPLFGGNTNPPFNSIPPPFCMTVKKVLDNTLIQYVNLGANGSGVTPFAGPVGLIVTPQVGTTIVKGMRLFASSGHPESDPADYLLEGSNDGGSTYTPIAGGLLAIPAQRNLASGPINITNQVLQEVTFANSAAYTTYRLTFTNVVNNVTSSNGLQIAEIQLLGAWGPVAPSITQQPASAVTLFSGGTLHASVAANGPGPFSYQWYRGVAKLNTNTSPSAGTGSLALSSPTAGTYTCVIGNGYGSPVTSSGLVLTIVSTATGLPYEKAVMALNPLAYWPLNEGSGPTALDYAGGYNGTYTNTGSISFADGGPSYPGFGSYTSANLFNQSGLGAYVDVPLGPFNITNAVTVISWVDTDSSSAYMDIIGHGDTSYRMAMASGDPAFNDNNLVSDATGSASIASGSWHMVAGVYSGGNGSTNNGLLYVDGLLVASNQIFSVTGNSLDLNIGGAPDYGSTRTFVGFISHAAVFSNALSAAQIQSLYGSAGVPPAIIVPASVTIDLGGSNTITETVTGNQPITNRWYYESNSATYTITGAAGTNLTLVLTNAQAGWTNPAYNFYFFSIVSNAYGNATSANITVTINTGAPGIQTDITPLWSQAPVGTSLTFSVTATNTEPFTYQWSTNSVAVLNATNSSYTFSALSGTNTYNVLVHNTAGSKSSSTATVVGYIAPPVAGFNTDGLNWTLNDGANIDPSITGNVLTLTDGGAAEASSAFYNIPQYIGGGFIVSFVYHGAGSGALGCGVTFCLQNSAAGSNAVGLAGGDLGYTSITNSAAFEMNILASANGGTGVQIGTGGSTPDSAKSYPAWAPTAAYSGTTPVSLASGDPIYVQLYYSSNTITAWLVDETTGSKFNTNYAITLPTVIGSGDAYIGFTGGTGSAGATQTISSFEFSANTSALPALSVAKGAVGSVVVSWPGAVTTLYQLQQSSIARGPWTNVSATPTLVGTTNQVTLTPGIKAVFYRLNLP